MLLMCVLLMRVLLMRMLLVGMLLVGMLRVAHVWVTRVSRIGKWLLANILTSQRRVSEAGQGQSTLQNTSCRWWHTLGRILHVSVTNTVVAGAGVAFFDGSSKVL